MANNPPTPPEELPEQVIDTLERLSQDQLRQAATYATALAEQKARERQEGEESDADKADEFPDDRPDGVPSKATVTTKEINDNRYHYWQWRDGEKIRSQYKGPADTAE